MQNAIWEEVGREQHVAIPCLGEPESWFLLVREIKKGKRTEELKNVREWETQG